MLGAESTDIWAKMYRVKVKSCQKKNNKHVSEVQVPEHLCEYSNKVFVLCNFPPLLSKFLISSGPLAPHLIVKHSAAQT